MTAQGLRGAGLESAATHVPDGAPEAILAHQILQAVAEAPPPALPHLVGALSHAQAIALARLARRTPEDSPPGEDRLLTMPQVAERLAVTEHQAREMGRRGELPVITVGNRFVRVRTKALDDWIRRQETGRIAHRKRGR